MLVNQLIMADVKKDVPVENNKVFTIFIYFSLPPNNNYMRQIKGTHRQAETCMRVLYGLGGCYASKSRYYT